MRQLLAIFTVLPIIFSVSSFGQTSENTQKNCVLNVTVEGNDHWQFDQRLGKKGYKIAFIEADSIDYYLSQIPDNQFGILVEFGFAFTRIKLIKNENGAKRPVSTVYVKDEKTTWSALFEELPDCN